MRPHRFACLSISFSRCSESTAWMRLTKGAMPYEVPFYVLRQSFVLRDKLLHMAFAENALAAIVSLLYHRGRMVFAYGNKFDTFGQRLLNLVYSFSYHLLLPFLPLPRRCLW